MRPQLDREEAAKKTLQYVLEHAHRQSPSLARHSQSLDSATLVKLLDQNFARIDTNDNGISREELAIALSNPHRFTTDEYAMLCLVSKFFDTIAALCDDQTDFEETVITRMDKEVLSQFLLHSKMTLQDLHNWVCYEKGDYPSPPP